MHFPLNNQMGNAFSFFMSYLCMEVRDIFRPLTLNAFIPGYTALAPSSSSIRRSWLYFATRSDLLGAPVLIWQVFSATARSAIVVSAVSPERCEEIAV